MVNGGGADEPLRVHMEASGVRHGHGQFAERDHHAIDEQGADRIGENRAQRTGLVNRIAGAMTNRPVPITPPGDHRQVARLHLPSGRYRRQVCRLPPCRLLWSGDSCVSCRLCGRRSMPPTSHDSGKRTASGTREFGMTELYIGSHLSTAGGWNALLERSTEEGGTAFAFFPFPTASVPKALDPAGAAAFGAHLKAEGYGPLVVHAPYVCNWLARMRPAHIRDRGVGRGHRAADRHPRGRRGVYQHSSRAHGPKARDRLPADQRGLNQVFERADGVMVLRETMAGKGTECGRNSMSRHDRRMAWRIRRTSASRSTPAMR